MIIQVDIDGVIADLLSEWIRLYNEDYQDTIRCEDVLEWDIMKAVKPECGTRIYQYLYNPDLYKGVRPIENALSGVSILRSLGHSIKYVSAGNPVSMRAKGEWLSSHGFMNQGEYIAIAAEGKSPDKSIIFGDVLIDDGVHNLETFAGTLPILFDAPYNRAEMRYQRAVRWVDVVNLILAEEWDNEGKPGVVGLSA